MMVRVESTPPDFATERRLIARAQAGDLEARNALVLGHYPFIIERVGVAVRMYRSAIVRGGWVFEDEVSEYMADGVAAFCRAVERFDAARAVGERNDGRGRLLTYCGIAIDRTVRRAIRVSTSAVRVPDRASMLHGVRQWEDPAYRALVKRARGTRRFQHWVCGGNSMRAQGLTSAVRTAGRVDGVLEDADAAIQARTLRRAMADLPGRERRVLEMRMEGRTLTDIGKTMGVTRERVRQIETKAVEGLREIMGVEVGSTKLEVGSGK